MLRIFNHYISGKLALLVVLEALVLTLAGYLGFSLHGIGSGTAILGSQETILLAAAAFGLGMLIVMTSMGLYQLSLWENTQSVLVRLFAAIVFGIVVAFLVLHLKPSFDLRPDALVIMVFVALTGSIFIRLTLNKWSNRGAFKSRVLVLGTGSRLMKLAEFAQRNQNHIVVGYLPLQPSKHYVPLAQVLPMMPGESLRSVVEKYRIEEIVIGIRDRRHGRLPLQQLLECRLKGIKITELTTFVEREHRQVLLESLTTSWMVLGEGFRQGFPRATVKRLFDLVVSGALLLLTFPVMLIAALCIVLESGLPVFYRQERSGESGRVFTIYKFRSMKHGAESNGAPRWAAANDDRTTAVGRTIRKLRIDELPQVINVFKGEMSFVGPRPERPFFVDQLVKQIPYYSLRHCVKPGITGWAQVHYPYGATLDDAIEKLQYDLYYVKNHSLFLDLMILIATVEVVLWGKGAR